MEELPEWWLLRRDFLQLVKVDSRGLKLTADRWRLPGIYQGRDAEMVATSKELTPVVEV